MSEGVEDAHTESKKSHKKEIRENDLIELNGELKFLWIFNKSWSDDLN